MINGLPRVVRGRRPAAKYAVYAAIVALATIAVVEAAGTMLTRSYSGLGGKLAPSSVVGAASPASTTLPVAAEPATPRERPARP